MREALHRGGLLKPALSEGEGEGRGGGRRGEEAGMKGVTEKHPGLPTKHEDEWADAVALHNTDHKRWF